MKVSGQKADKPVCWGLEAIGGAGGDWTVALGPFPFIVGRDEDCHLTLTGKWISRRHAEVRKSGDHLWIRDLGSTNSTFLNHQKLEQAELLQPGDIISIGNFQFSVKHIEPYALETIDEETCTMDIGDEIAQAYALGEKLRMLLRERLVTPHFQPIITFADMTVKGYEVLGRPTNDDLPSDPAELFGVAECLGCVADLSALFREVGLELAEDLPGSFLLFVNSAPVEFYRMDAMLASLEKFHRRQPERRVVLEISEKATVDKGEMARLREALAQLNMGLAYDDFGVGESRLAELAKVSPDFLKFDISLIREIHLAPKRFHQMVTTFVKAAQDMGVATLAEGIECAEEAEVCRQLGFEFAQGFFYGKPVPVSDVLKTIKFPRSLT